MTSAKSEICEILKKFYQFVHLICLLPEALKFKTSMILHMELTKLEKNVNQTSLEDIDLI